MRFILPTMLVILAATFSGCAGAGAPKAKPQVSVSGASATRSTAMQQQPTTLAAGETGKASWYGGKFHGRPTASGETFDENAMTAAHKRHKFGTKVRVTNQVNGQSIVVRINDRMPDTSGNKGRVIDLSKGAFEKVSPLNAGLFDATVEVVQ